MHKVGQSSFLKFFDVPAGAFPVPWGKEKEEPQLQGLSRFEGVSPEEYQRRLKTQNGLGWAPAQIAPASVSPRRTALGQTSERKILNLENPQVYDWALLQGSVLAYSLVASLIYGRSIILDRIILGLGSLGFAGASLASFLMLDHRPNWHPVNGVVGATMGTANALVAIASGIAAFTPKIPRTSPADAIAKSVPI